MIVIEVYADIWCPFTHVGLRRLVDRRDQAQVEASLRVRPWPLELVNGRPMDADFIGEEVDDLRTQAAPDLFAGFRTDAFPVSTLGALALAESAYGESHELGEAMSLALRDALFEHGRDVGDDAVLAELASALSVPAATDAHRDAVEASWTEGKQRGVVGSPHFFTSQGDFFCPSLDIERVDGHLVIKPDLEAFEEFVAVCFS